MNCAEARALVQHRIDNRQELESHNGLDAHLSACSECRELHRDLLMIAGFGAALAGPETAGRSMAGPVLSAIRSERRRTFLQRLALAASAAAALLIVNAVDRDHKPPAGTRTVLAKSPENFPEPPPENSPEPVSRSVAAERLVNEWQVFVVTRQTPAMIEAAAAQAEQERGIAEELFRSGPVNEKPELADERRRKIREAAAMAAETLGDRGVTLLVEAVSDPKRAQEVLAGITGQSRKQLLPVFIEAMRHPECRAAAAVLAEEATGLQLGANFSTWRTWLELDRSPVRALSPIEAATGLELRVPTPKEIPELNQKGVAPFIIT